MKGASRKTRVAEIINKGCVFKGEASLFDEAYHVAQITLNKGS